MWKICEGNGHSIRSIKDYFTVQVYYINFFNKSKKPSTFLFIVLTIYILIIIFQTPSNFCSLKISNSKEVDVIAWTIVVRGEECCMFNLA